MNYILKKKYEPANPLDKNVPEIKFFAETHKSLPQMKEIYEEKIDRILIGEAVQFTTTVPIITSTSIVQDLIRKIFTFDALLNVQI